MTSSKPQAKGSPAPVKANPRQGRNFFQRWRPPKYKPLIALNWPCGLAFLGKNEKNAGRHFNTASYRVRCTCLWNLSSACDSGLADDKESWGGDFVKKEQLWTFWQVRRICWMLVTAARPLKAFLQLSLHIQGFTFTTYLVTVANCVPSVWRGLLSFDFFGHLLIVILQSQVAKPTCFPWRAYSDYLCLVISWSRIILPFTECQSSYSPDEATAALQPGRAGMVGFG